VSRSDWLLLVGIVAVAVLAALVVLHDAGTNGA